MHDTMSEDGGELSEPGSDHYDSATRAFHWATVLLVLCLYGLAETWGFAARGSDLRHLMQNTHVSLGILLTIVLLARIVWRSTRGRTLPVRNSWDERVAKATHIALYLLLVAEALLGWNFRWAQNEPLSFFGLVTVPAPFGYGIDLRHTIGTLHDWTAQAIMILAGVHAAAALFHHYVLRDAVFGRMVPPQDAIASGSDRNPVLAE